MKRIARLCLISLLTSSLFPFSITHASAYRPVGQDPKPQEPAQTDKRGLGVQAAPSPTPNTQTTQTKTTTAKPEIVLQAGITSPQTQLAFSPDGKLLASMGMTGNSIKLWEVSTGRLLRQLESSVPTIGASSMTRPFRFSADGRALTAVTEGRVRRWDVETGKELSNSLLPNVKNLSIGLLTDDSRFFAGLNFDSSAVRVWDLSSGTELRSIAFDEAEHLTGQYSIAISPDGKQIAAVTSRYDTPKFSMKAPKAPVSKDQVSIWDIASGKRVSTVTIETSQLVIGQMNNLPVAIVGFSSDGTWLGVRTRNNFKILEAASGKDTRAITVPPVPPDDQSGMQGFTTQFAFSPDNQVLAVITDPKEVTLLNPTTNSNLHVLKGHTGNIFGISFSHDGKLLASSGGDNEIKLWNVSSGDQVKTFTGAAVPVSDLAFSRDGKTLTMAGEQSVSLWELTTGGVRRAVSFPDESTDGFQNPLEQNTVLSPDGKLVMQGERSHAQVKIWDVATGKQTTTVPLTENKVLGKGVFNQDGRLVAVLEANKQKQSTSTKPAPTPSPTSSNPQAPSGTPRGMPQGMPQMPQGMPDMTKIMEEMRKDPKKVQAEMKKAQEAIEKGDLSGGMSVMQSYGLMPKPTDPNPRSLRVVEANSGRQISTVQLSSGFFNEMQNTTMSAALALRPDGGMLASSSGYGSPIQLTDSTNGQQMQTLKTPFSLGVNSLAWSLDGKRLASSQWAMKKGITSQNADDFSFEDMSFSIKLWDPQTGAEVSTLAGHKNFVMRLAFSPDGHQLASGSFDSTVKIWDVDTGRELHTLLGHSGLINALDFSPDGKFLVSGSDDGSTRLWNAKTGELLATLASLNGGNDWLVVTPSGLFDGSPRGWNQILWRFSPTLTDVSPVEIFFNEYFHPGLLTDILEGKKLEVTQDISQKDRRQPQLTLNVADAQGGKISARNSKVNLNITNAPAGAQDVRLFRNGSLVKVWRGDVLKGQPSTSLETTVSFVAGPNELKAYAFNRDNVKSSDATVVLDGADSLKKPGTLHLIAVGVNEYENPEYNLKYAAADAASFAQEVERQQRKLGQYQHIQVTSLADKNATKANVMYVLSRLAGNQNATKPAGAPGELDSISAAQPEDAVIVFFAGHGTAQQQRFYLIPHDIGYQGKRTELDRAGLQSILTHGVSDLELEDAFASIDAGVMLMIIDACNSGQALEAEEKRRGPMNSKGLAQLAYEKGMYILTAAQSYQAALEASQLGHGYLTYALVEEGLKTPAADVEPKDGEVELREWLDYATERVPDMQQEKMHAARGLRIDLAFVEGEEKADVDKRNVQRPRVFYRREQEPQPVIIAKQ